MTVGKRIAVRRTITVLFPWENAAGLQKHYHRFRNGSPQRQTAADQKSLQQDVLLTITVVKMLRFATTENVLLVQSATFVMTGSMELAVHVVECTPLQKMDHV
jgi:hypothetical protein